MENNNEEPSLEAGLCDSVQAQRLMGSPSSSSVSPMTSTLSTEPAQAESQREDNRPPPPGSKPVTTQPPSKHSFDHSTPLLENQTLHTNTEHTSSTSTITTLEPYSGSLLGKYQSSQRKPKGKNISRAIIDRKIKNLLRTEDLFRVDKFPTYYVLTFPGTDIRTELNVIAVDSEIRTKIGNPKKITKLNKNSLLIQISNEKQGKILKELKTIIKHPVTCEPHRSLNTVKGTVKSETLGQIPMDDLLKTLEPQGVSKIERMKWKVENELKDTDRYVMTFNRTKLPSLIKLTEWHHEIVEAYIPKPARCTKCQKFGHFRKWCRKEKDVCVRCGGEDHYQAACFNEAKCVNCSGNHPASSVDCPIYKYRCEVIATMVNMHITHAEAMDIVKEQFRLDGKQYSTMVKKNTQPATKHVPNMTEVPTIRSVPQVSSDKNESVRKKHSLLRKDYVKSDLKTQKEIESHSNTIESQQSILKTSDQPLPNIEIQKEIKSHSNTITTPTEIVKTIEPKQNISKTADQLLKPDQKSSQNLTPNVITNPIKNHNKQETNHTYKKDSIKTANNLKNKDAKNYRARSHSLSTPKKSNHDERLSVSDHHNKSLGVKPPHEEYEYLKRKREAGSDLSPPIQNKIIKSDKTENNTHPPFLFPPPPPMPPPLPQFSYQGQGQNVAEQYNSQRRRGSYNIQLIGHPP